MEHNSKCFQKLKRFCEVNEQFRIAFELTEKDVKLTEQEKCENLLSYIGCELLVLPQYFDEVFDYFSEELPKLLFTAVFFNGNHKYNNARHVVNSIVLSKVVKKRNDLESYALKYFGLYCSPFEADIQESSKKRKMNDNIKITDLDIVESSYFLLKSNPDFYRCKWNWSIFVQKYLNHDPKVMWLACHTLAILLGMNERQLERLIYSKVTPEVDRKFTCSFDLFLTLTSHSDIPHPIDQHPIIATQKQCNEQVTNISGIYVPIVDNHNGNKQNASENALVEVASTYNNLRKIALGLTSNKAVCLQGPVGSGKTSLVEHLAFKTGRKLGENFVKVQLGDQTDSKMLLGTYRCTDVPGEFVWQPGVLTQAVLEGNWLLLEDIDSASMDIASVLTSLLENHSLNVPGYRDSVPITPGFQLFVTQRFVSTITGHHKKHSNAMTLMEKHLLQISVDPLTSEELKQILETHYVEFRTITDRMISVFMLFSREATDSKIISIPRGGRLISTRDFFKWCSRAIVDFDVKSQASALKVLQDAIDVFCCSYSNSEEALNLAKQISTHLGIINQKAEYFFKLYKPSMKLTPDSLVAGRAVLKRENNEYSKQVKFSFTRPTAVLLERIMCCVNLKEPVLLVGETGTGKTSSVQYLAHTIGQKLVVINMNQQSDSADLLGGFKPVDLKFVVAPIRREFEQIFCDYFKVEPNKKYLGNIALCFNSQRWSDLVKLMNRSYQAAIGRLTESIAEFKRDRGKKTASESEENVNKSKKDKEFLERWQAVGEKLHKLELQLKQKNALAFAFIEGSLVKAVENGYWVLLDEINLANAETLECLSGLLEGSRGSLCLLERGDKQPVKRHPNFTLFACMNPSTDVGKKDLPAGLRNRFTEFFVDELNEKSDLLLLVNNYLEAMPLKDKELDKVVDFYLKVRKETIATLSDGLGHKPHFSLRSLCRALVIASKNPCGMFKRSLYEAFCLSFLTQLDNSSYQIVERMISSYLIGDSKAVNAVKKQPIPEPQERGERFLQFEGYWVRKGPLESVSPEDYILTASVRKNLKDLVRVVSIGKLPVLLQGDTSVGKTSLITYLAKSSGNKCVRINNHEHTDLQEYIGSYVADAGGKLVFREGLLVEAMRKGHWIILDELNLAPTDVLEALNRVLDDNRELFIPETQQTVKADANFMLFATQNPPGAYGGRKMLSRAFRNRFVELHFNEIPPAELETILHKRCQMAPSYAKKMISVMIDLQTRRRGSAAFAGKQGFITLRDLFRWGVRYRLAQNTKKLYDWDQHLADEGYLVLAGRVRRAEEKSQIVDVLQKHLKREVKPESLFTLSDKTSTITRHILVKIEENRSRYGNIVWTYNMRQLAVLVAKALEFREPVLLVGETGGGKTTVCKLIAENNGQELVTVNCHMHTESSDFVGGLRPVRDHSDDDSSKLFEWVDGPLLHAMLKGHVFLADEISLADDSVLERLNSLLEPERSLLLAEKGIDLNNAENSELIVADPNFHFIGTMNPGGDFGKKELSPALRNRFTEIWCESCTDRDDLVAIIEQNIRSGISLGNQQDGSSGIGKSIMDFVEWFKTTEVGKRFTVSIRDILTWVQFLNRCVEKLDVGDSYIHGACLTFLDSLGSGVTSTESLKTLDIFRNECYTFLINQVEVLTNTTPSVSMTDLPVETINNKFGIKPFYVEMGNEDAAKTNFSFNAPTTVFNTLRLLRGMQLNKAILLEGSPGVGKTSLVTALAKFTGHKIFRVNLSDQTDISDLFGADLPVEGGSGGQFSWRDGPLLQALRDGSWILLDELNLASQSVLEGLNACLDHRGEIFIPELGKTFYVKQGTRFFACQNPLKQGGSRRGLPKSFLNRFIQVYVHSLTDKDLHYILSNQFNILPPQIVAKMIVFNSRIVKELDSYSFGQKGAPWECNLRDLTRWCEAMIYHYNANLSLENEYQPESVMQLIYGDRMRTLSDKEKVKDEFERVFQCKVCGTGPIAYVNKQNVYIGDVAIERNSSGVNTNVLKQGKTCLVLRSQLPALRSLAYCVNLNWMSILVGSSGSGKSCVVKTLANLAGKSLKTLPVTSAMDTTDILGGFEQTDYSRHLDEIAKQTERLLLGCLQELLINANTVGGVELLMQWESYLAIDGGTKQSMEEDAKLFLRKIVKLNEIWDKLKLSVNGDDIRIVEQLQEKSAAISKSVKTEGSLNAGGKFEWVDSVLIKCLQDGSWLLIDNVNLCSSAVLDRLNALLEPQGVLTISERGVDQNGLMVEVKPHKDFRLFLTMDPKNGEISRAMRNRGVEIYLLTEVESKKLNQFDIKSLINLEGLKEADHINALLKVHDFISDLTLGEKPHINEILQASSLISQQINHGVETLEAFSSAAIEVYYKTRSAFEFNCNDTVRVIKSEIQKILNDSLALQENQEKDLYSENVTLKTQNIEAGSGIEKVKQQCAVLKKYLPFVQGFDTSLFHFILNFYSITSVEDLEMRHVYLKNNLNDPSLADFIDKLHEAALTLKQSKDTSLPLDYRWLPEAPYNTKDAASSNKLNLALHMASSYFKEELELNAIKSKSRTQKSVTLLDYMHEKQKRKVEDKFNDVVVNEYLQLIEGFDEYLNNLPKQIEDITDVDVIKILRLVFWRFAFHRCTAANVKKIKAAEQHNILINLTVHYKWFYKYAVREISSISKVDLPEHLKVRVDSITNKLETQFSFMQKVGKNYQKCSDKPPPYINEHQLEVVPAYNAISNCYDLCKTRSDLINVLNILKGDKDLRPLLLDMKSKLDFDFTDASEELVLLKSMHEKHQTEGAKGTFPEYERQLLPIIDYLTQLTVKDSMRASPRIEVSSMATNSMLVPIDFSGALLCYARTHDARLLHEITKSYYLYLMNSASVKPSKYLKGNEDADREVVLSNFSPKLTYYLGSLLVNANDLNKSGVVRLGNYRELTRQHNHLSQILWRNLHQLSERSYDCICTEKEYILSIFKIFIVQFADSLHIKNTINKTLQQIINDCIQALRQLKEHTSLTDPSDDAFKFIKRLQGCSVKITKLANSSDVDTTLSIIADLYMELSYLKATLNSKLPVIDPLAKKALKKEHCLRAIDMFRDIKKCYELQNELYSNTDLTVHAYHAPVNQVISDLEVKNEELGQYVAVRSKDVMYEAVLRVVNHAFSTILSESYVNKMSATLAHHILHIINALSRKERIDYTHFLAQLNQHESTVSSYDNLIHEWNSLRNTFPDIVEPLLSNIVEFLYGLKMKLSLLRKLVTQYENMALDVNVQEELLNLVKLPALDERQSSYSKHIETITSNRIYSFVNLVLESREFPHVKEQETFRLLRCGIHESFNYCLLDTKGADKLNKNTFMKFNELVGVFVSAWSKQQEDKEKQQREADSLYKTRTKCDDKPEEEQIEEELKELFPNYHVIDFPDLQSGLGDEDPEESLSDSEYKGTISYEDLKFVVQLHMTLVQNYTRTEWLNPGKNKNVIHDFIKPLLEKFKVFKQILDKQFHCLDYTVDTKLISSFNVLLAVAQRYGKTNDLDDQTSTAKTNMLNKKNRDFYKDSNVDEVKSCYHILEELRIKVNELLDEWPDQPTLKTILLVIERVYDFDITSPVSRFLTGFEILLSKCHEWEEVAHSGVSLSQHYQNVTHQIISWRKLELAMWKDLLNRTYERLNEPMAKWWLYMHNIMEQFIVSRQITEKELIETLQSFITKSNLAEFEGRLNLLYVFHCHATYLDRTRETELFISILWNLFCYFRQFGATVSNKIKDLKSPIEKKLKDYVKIVKWKDINYWAIKETVDKSHKTLHKYVREFQNVLQQPVLSYLVNTSSGVAENVGIWDRPQRQNPKTYHYTLDADAYVARQSLAKKIHSAESKTVEGLMSKVETYFLKSRKFCKQIILATSYPSLVQTLDGFVTEIIETSSHLQGVEVDTNLPKEKQKSQAKNILQQKHRALADLFKSLSKIGLSFRTGIIESKLKSPSADFVLKPVDLSANFGHINHSRQEEKILTIWDSCETYYVRSLMRADVLESALTNPAKDLGLQNIERCKGFTLHLMNLAQKQKSELIESTRVYYYLRFYAKQLNDSCEGKSFLHVEALENTRQLLKNVTIVMSHCKIILNSCPIEDDFGSEVSEVPVLKSEVKDRVEYKNDATWFKAMSLISDILTSASKLNSVLRKCQGIVPSVEYDLVCPEFVAVADLINVETDLIGIYKNLDNLKQIFGSMAINDSLSWLMKEIGLIGEQFEKRYPDEITCSVEEFKKQIEKFAERNLIVVQNMYKKYVSVITEKKSKETSEESVEDKQLLEEHLKNLLMENLSSDISALEMRKILRTTHKISNVLLKTPPNCSEDLKTLVYQCLPLLEQTIQLYRYFITQQVSAYRVTCKMNCILLNIFIDLASKGFCVPPEFSDEMDNEGVSKPTDGLGLGEGQGERDVSDKIESEDQLDDAQPAGQEKEKEEDKDCKEEEKGIEMSEDFDSKLQDKEKKDGDDEDKSDDDSDGSEQMGETEKGADQLDQEIWGSDKEDGDDDEEGADKKEEKGDKGEKEGPDQLGAKDEKPSQDDSEEKEDQSASEEKEKNKKDINEMDEPEYDDDQIDPHHGKQPELPEPEPMDLPDDLQLDDGQENENENQEENPFDIDTMKEQTMPEEKPDDGEDKKEDESKNDEEKDFSSDDEDITKKGDDDDDENDDNEKDMETPKEDGKDVNETSEIDKEDKEDEDGGEGDETALDQTHTNQENVEAMEIDEADAADKTEVNQSENQKSSQPIEELCQEDRPDKEGVGQSQMEESTTGHSAQTSAPQDIKSAKRDLEEDQMKKLKPGESDSQRSLGDVTEPVKKKLKTMNAKEQGEPEPEEERDEKEEAAEMYQHIKDAKDPATQVLDAATKEQAENQTKEVPNKEDEEADKPTESNEDLPSEECEDVDIAEVPEVEKSEKTEKTKDTKRNKRQHPEGDIMEDIRDIDIEGDVVETTTVGRNADSTHHTQYANIVETTANRLSLEEINDLRCEVERQLSAWNDPPATIEAEQTWQKISAVTSSLAQDLSEQLRLVLEPTQASRLRGDFRTGRRINMRKVIPYIASQFRKDKIWLRRTKPSKREYQIVLAIDDSSSMADNRSKELAFESVSLISKALTLLESGQLSVIGFGETIEVLHKLTDQFTDKSGVKLLQKFRFDQNKTCVAKLVDFATEMLGQSQTHSSALNAKLLVIVSDGRGVFSEGETYVRQAVRRAKLSNIFMVFVIIDNPENKSSILDIRMPVFKDGKLLGIQTYMDVFPFSFYIILRDINSLPSVLSDALRQWFEIVSNLDKD